MNTYTKLREKVNSFCNDLRSLQYLTAQSYFEIALADDELNEIPPLVEKAMSQDWRTRSEALESLKKIVHVIAFGDLTTRDLKNKAMKLNIRGWSRMTKSELLSAIYHKERPNAASRAN